MLKGNVNKMEEAPLMLQTLRDKLQLSCQASLIDFKAEACDFHIAYRAHRHGSDVPEVEEEKSQVKVTELNRTLIGLLEYTMGQFEVTQPHLLEPRRTDVLTVSPWLAPIVWEGAFDSRLIDNMYKDLNITVATTVFAVGKYIQLLQPFLESAEKHYMVSHRVHYYVFTDQMNKVPQVALAPGRFLTVLPVPGFSRWQEISLRRMEFIRKAIEDHNIHQTAHYIFCTDVDMVFENRFGAEAFGELVAAVHPWFYYLQRQHFTYERRKASQAYVPLKEGDFYYAGALFGGRVDNVYRLTRVCEEQLNIDKKNNIEAAWQEESHLNRYFILNKPTKLLSPEYIWDKMRTPTPEHIKLVRFTTIKKSYAELRPN